MCDCKCQRCGECCKWLDFNVGKMNMELMEFYQAKGLQIYTMGDYLMVRVPYRCQWLTENDQCGIYPSRPAVCKRYCCCKSWALGPHSKKPIIAPLPALAGGMLGPRL